MRRVPPRAVGSRSPAVPVAASDSVAEGALQCVAILLRKCAPNSSEVVLDLLQILAHVLDLPRDATSEEVRHTCDLNCIWLLCRQPAIMGFKRAEQID